jgi:glutamate:GABA antiporter
MRTSNVLRLICLNVVAIDSLRNLPIIAGLGSNLLFLYLATALIFLVPAAQVSRQIARIGLEKGGGASVYQFTEIELGARFAKAQSLFLWTYNLLWYPTLMVFLGSFLHTILKPYIGLTGLSFAMLIPVFLLSFSSVRFSSTLSALLGLFGAIIPMTILATYAFVKIFSMPHVAANYFTPNVHHFKLAFVPTVFFSLMGIEIATTHSDKLFTKKKEWNVALFISVPVIIFLLVGCGLAVWELGQGQFLDALSTSLIRLFAFAPIPHIAGLMIILISMSIIAQAVFWMQATARAITKATTGKADWQKARVAIIIQVAVTALLMAVILFAKSLDKTFLYISNLSVLLAVIYYLILMLAYWKYARGKKKASLLAKVGIAGVLILLITTIITL